MLAHQRLALAQEWVEHIIPPFQRLSQKNVLWFDVHGFSSDVQDCKSVCRVHGCRTLAHYLDGETFEYACVLYAKPYDKVPVVPSEPGKVLNYTVVEYASASSSDESIRKVTPESRASITEPMCYDGCDLSTKNAAKTGGRVSITGD